jgi:hypothetical protein
MARMYVPDDMTCVVRQTSIVLSSATVMNAERTLIKLMLLPSQHDILDADDDVKDPKSQRQVGILCSCCCSCPCCVIFEFGQH